MFAKMRILAVAGIFALSSTVLADITEDLLKMVEGGKCLEAAVADMVAANQGQGAGDIVSAAYALLPIVAEQQQKLNCTGNIGQAAIAAGADPNEVLAATAAGGAPGAGGAPANLGGIGGGTVGGGGGGVISPS